MIGDEASFMSALAQPINCHLKENGQEEAQGNKQANWTIILFYLISNHFTTLVLFSIFFLIMARTVKISKESANTDHK